MHTQIYVDVHKYTITYKSKYMLTSKHTHLHTLTYVHVYKLLHINTCTYKILIQAPANTHKHTYFNT